MAKRGRFINSDASPENILQLWARIHAHDDLITAQADTINTQAQLITTLQASLVAVGKKAQQALITASTPKPTAGVDVNQPTGTGGGTTPSDPPFEFNDDIGDQLAVVQAQAVLTPLTPASTVAEIFDFVRKVAWTLTGLTFHDPNGAVIAGLLEKNAGENIFTCNGHSYSISRVCFSNGHIFKILGDAGPGGANTPSWQDNGGPGAYLPAVDPSLPC